MQEIAKEIDEIELKLVDFYAKIKNHKFNDREAQNGALYELIRAQRSLARVSRDLKNDK